MVTPPFIIADTLPPEPPQAFARLVARNVIYKRIAIIFLLGLPLPIMFTLSDSWSAAWGLAAEVAIAVAWLALDIIAIQFRVTSGEYGSTFHEVMEAAAYVVRNNNQGGGRRFKGIFGGRVKSLKPVHITDGVIAGSAS